MKKTKSIKGNSTIYDSIKVLRESYLPKEIPDTRIYEESCNVMASDIRAGDFRNTFWDDYFSGEFPWKSHLDHEPTTVRVNFNDYDIETMQESYRGFCESQEASLPLTILIEGAVVYNRAKKEKTDLRSGREAFPKMDEYIWERLCTEDIDFIFDDICNEADQLYIKMEKISKVNLIPLSSHILLLEQLKKETDVLSKNYNRLMTLYDAFLKLMPLTNPGTRSAESSSYAYYIDSYKQITGYDEGIQELRDNLLQINRNATKLLRFIDEEATNDSYEQAKNDISRVRKNKLVYTENEKISVLLQIGKTIKDIFERISQQGDIVSTSEAKLNSLKYFVKEHNLGVLADLSVAQIEVEIGES